MTRVLNALRFIWEFTVGDDWRVALGVVCAIAATALLSGAGIASWWILPVAVAGLLTFSVLRAAAAHDQA